MRFGYIIALFSEQAAALNSKDEKFTSLASIAEERLEWLDQQLNKLDKPFSWEMPKRFLLTINVCKHFFEVIKLQ
ncbi:hypothetical protein GN958_ATG19720 [Phytophthora infestans]|uniref:Uncharacterized protein n=1 Tax=Phytophthora infestans TaxID=4787 RepID=A0A8S9TQC0_PHYIN|nr:hypothetical protein GN958_ATG19720 [Phytophthora infestans]